MDKISLAEHAVQDPLRRYSPYFRSNGDDDQLGTVLSLIDITV